MFLRYSISIIALFVLFSSCGNTTETNIKQTNNKQTDSTSLVLNEKVDNDFHEFITKFSTDTAFQLSRTKFPLKIGWHEIDRDTVIFRTKSDFEFIDFRTKKFTGPIDQWEQNIVIDNKNKSATIQIRGVDNGIFIDYKFNMVDGAWLFTEIDDSST